MRMMMRRKADPKTEDHTLCEPAQSKYTVMNISGRATLHDGNLQVKCRRPR